MLPRIPQLTAVRWAVPSGARSLGESDGAMLVAPLVTPILAVVAILAFIAAFGDYIISKIVLVSEDNWTLAVGMFQWVSNQLSSNWGLFAAGAILALAALVSVLISAVAVVLSARRYATRYTDAAAVLKCLGLSRRRVQSILLLELLWLGIAAGIVGVGIGYQLVLVVAALCAAQALHISGVGITSLLVFMPAVLILQVLPIGIAGLGVREAAFVLFLQPLGVPPEQTLVIGDIGADVEAAHAAGARSALVPNPATRSDEIIAAPVVVRDLLAAARLAVERT